MFNMLTSGDRCWYEKERGQRTIRNLVRGGGIALINHVELVCLLISQHPGEDEINASLDEPIIV